MAIADDFTVATNGDIRYVGAAHGDSAAGYYSVIDFHRWLGDLADDAVASAVSSDFLDMTFNTPSSRQTDNIIELTNGYNIDQTASEHLFDGSIIQGGGTDIWDGLVVLANQGMNLQIVQDGARVTNDFWNYSVKGSHTGAADASVLTDSGASWTTDEWVGYYIENTTDGSFGVITANTSTTITATLEGGTENDWDNGDNYQIVAGLNADAGSGYSHRFMIKVRTAGSDIDGRRLIGQTRVWYKTYSEFRIGTGTARGNNVLALNYSDDLNNQKPYDTVAGYTTITNTTAGYNAIDVNADSTDEFYYSEWNVNKPTRSINDFYERAKYLTHQDTSETLYGLNGELFRGITHELDVDGGTGTWGTPEHEEITWTGGSGQLLAVDNKTGTSTTKIWFQLTTGVVPTDNLTITGTTSSATAVADTSTGSLTSRPLSFPFVGQSTGSAIIGSYGLGVETDDLTSNDQITALDGIVYTPPNNQNFFVTGVVSTEDYILVGPYDGVGDFEFTQGTVPAGGYTGGETTIDVDAGAGEASWGNAGNAATDTPSSGTLRIQDDNGVYQRVTYTGYSATDANTIQFTGCSGVPAATAGNNVFVSYIDKLASSTSESFQATYAGDRSLYVRVRDGGAGKGDTPIVTFESEATFGSAGGTSTVIRNDDY